MTITKKNGYRVYQLLIPVAAMVDGQEVHFDEIELKPVTFKLERQWEDGAIDGHGGMLDALMRELVVQPFEAVEAMVHPDSNRFIQEFMMHLPPGMASSITTGNFPSPAVEPASPPSYSADVAPTFGPEPGEYDRPRRSALPGEEPIHEPPDGYFPDPAGAFEPSPGKDADAARHPLGVDLDG